ncbi:aminotransferase class I/II-fold pyridoxal phosphate-dependent enzyme [bacterium]|nr:aminotransferase class I/II-fold pyridoxal phosphate-dependent enzyme [bacterium]
MSTPLLRSAILPHPLHVGRPNTGDRQRLQERIDALLDRNWLSNDGPLVREFEARVAAIAGTRHCVAMCNATVALEIATRAAGLTGEVIVPAYTFVATAHALQWQQLTPVFCDIDPVTHNIDPEQIARLITPRTSAIIGVHVWGRGCDTDALECIANKHGLILMYDAAHAFGCGHQNQPIGSFGLAEVFSFHATKFVNCAEGGAVVTNNDALADKMRLMRNFGFSGYDRVIYIGTNGKMSEFSAAVGLTSLDSMSDFIAVNYRNYQAYQQALADLPGITVQSYNESERQNYQYLVLDVDPAVCPLTRDQILQVLHAHHVLARRYFFPGVHRMEPYRAYYPNAYLLLPVTEDVVQRVIVMPTGTAVTPEMIAQIGDILRWAMTHSAELSEQLEARLAPGDAFDGFSLR